jgi:hypothetical protein
VDLKAQRRQRPLAQSVKIARIQDKGSASTEIMFINKYSFACCFVWVSHIRGRTQSVMDSRALRKIFWA